MHGIWNVTWTNCSHHGERVIFETVDYSDPVVARNPTACFKPGVHNVIGATAGLGWPTAATKVGHCKP